MQETVKPGVGRDEGPIVRLSVIYPTAGTTLTLNLGAIAKVGTVNESKLDQSDDRLRKPGQKPNCNSKEGPILSLLKNEICKAPKSLAK